MWCSKHHHQRAASHEIPKMKLKCPLFVQLLFWYILFISFSCKKFFWCFFFSYNFNLHVSNVNRLRGCFSVSHFFQLPPVSPFVQYKSICNLAAFLNCCFVVLSLFLLLLRLMRCCYFFAEFYLFIFSISFFVLLFNIDIIFQGSRIKVHDD